MHCISEGEQKIVINIFAFCIYWFYLFKKLRWNIFICEFSIYLKKNVIHIIAILLNADYFSCISCGWDSRRWNNREVCTRKLWITMRMCSACRILVDAAACTRTFYYIYYFCVFCFCYFIFNRSYYSAEYIEKLLLKLFIARHVPNNVLRQTLTN